jgi:hypothetical protein
VAEAMLLLTVYRRSEVTRVNRHMEVTDSAKDIKSPGALRIGWIPCRTAHFTSVG